MQYNRYLLAGMIMLMIAILIMLAEFVAGPSAGHINPDNSSYLNIDNLEKAILIAIPPFAAGIYIIGRHRLKKA